MSKRVEIIALGNELLSGNVINSNAAFISKQLFDIGITVDAHLAIPDEKDTIKEALQDSLNRSDLVITTGGLGPTVDDITREAIASVTNCKLKINEKVLKHLKERYSNRVPNIEEQANIPERAKPLLNYVGTASGLILESDGKYLIVLPGVPVEMKEMVTQNVIPFLRETFVVKDRPISQEIHLHSIRESDVNPTVRELQEKNSDLSFGVYPHLGIVTIRITCSEKLQQRAKQVLEQIKERFSSHFFEGVDIVEAIHRTFIEKGLTLTTAESCTGGRIAAELTHRAGASDYFLGSVVAYSNALKQSLLGVPEELINQHGAVSAEVVEAMLLGLLKRTESDYGIAVTGIAGPSGGTKEKPVGTIWCAIGKRGEKPDVWQLPPLRGNREGNIIRAVHLALGRILTLV